jgi:hypothetical protein
MNKLTVLTSTISIVVGFLTAAKTILEIRKLLHEEDQQSKKRIAKTVAQFAAITIALLFSISTVWLLSTQKEELSAQNIANSQEAEKLKQEAEKVNQELAKSRRTSVEEFIRVYQVLIQRADEAVTRYTSFNSETKGMQSPELRARQKELLEDAKVKLLAVTDHVAKWKPVFDGLNGVSNGRIRSLDDALRAQDYGAAFQSLKILKETINSDIARLRTSLNAVSKTGTK